MLSTSFFCGSYQCLRFIGNQLFPIRCLWCGLATNHPHYFCSACYQRLPWLESTCKQCAISLPRSSANNHCGSCLKHPPPFTQATSLFHYQMPIDLFIRQLKFKEHYLYARIFADLLAAKLSQVYENQSPPQCIIPVPLHTQRLQQRGFNQAELIAQRLSHILGWPLEISLVARVLNTPAQTLMNAEHRRNNLRQAFAIQTKQQYQRVLVVDDVITTMQTMIALTHCIAKNGVEDIHICSVARTEF